MDKFINSAKDTLSGDEGKKRLDQAQNAANKATSGQHEDKVQQARGYADKAFGHDGNDGGKQGDSKNDR